MTRFGSRFGDDEEGFDSYDEFVSSHTPDPGAFLTGHDVLDGEDHVAFHALTRDIFDERGVYDMTFGYNLARLNLDRRHPNAGYRYAEEANDAGVLRAEFTPTTEFCPQSHTLTKGSFRAWNGLRDRHDYDVVRVRVAPMHHESETTNDELRQLEDRFRETGTIADPTADDRRGSTPIDQANRNEDPNRETRSPF